MATLLYNTPDIQQSTASYEVPTRLFPPGPSDRTRIKVKISSETEKYGRGGKPKLSVNNLSHCPSVQHNSRAHRAGIEQKSTRGSWRIIGWAMEGPLKAEIHFNNIQKFSYVTKKQLRLHFGAIEFVFGIIPHLLLIITRYTAIVRYGTVLMCHCRWQLTLCV